MSEDNSIVLKMILSNDNGLGNIECEIDDWQGIYEKQESSNHHKKDMLKKKT